MKKTFQLTHLKKENARQVEAVKHEINKYLARERRKKLPEGMDFWDFDCQFGNDSTTTKNIHVSEINKCIDEQAGTGASEFFIVILAKAARRLNRPKK